MIKTTERDTLISMSGLEFMQAIRDGRIEGPPIGRTLGFEVAELAEGTVTFHGTPGPNATNPMGTVHGGWYGTILDSCMACAVMTRVPKGFAYTTLEYKVNIIRPIPPGTKVVATGIASHVGRATGVASGEIRGIDDDRLYATGSTTCIIMPL